MEKEHWQTGPTSFSRQPMPLLATTEDTLDWGRALAASLQAGDVVALCGQLGAGKTHVVKGLLA